MVINTFNGNKEKVRCKNKTDKGIQPTDVINFNDVHFLRLYMVMNELFFKK